MMIKLKKVILKFSFVVALVYPTVRCVVDRHCTSITISFHNVFVK